MDASLLAAIINNSEDAIISKTLEGFITSWNQAAERMFGYTEKEMIGKHISILIPFDKLDEEIMIIDNISQGKRVQHFETLRVTKDGRQIPISLTISPIKDTNGKIIGASKIARDITQQKKTEQEMQMLYEEVKILNSRKDEFISLAGHELRTPLTTIKGYLQLLEISDATGQEKEFIGKSLKQVNKLNQLVNDLLDISKIQAGELEYNIKPVLLYPLILESIETVKQMFSTHHIDLCTNPTPICVLADTTRIEQVLINLISNAVKYSPNQQHIMLSVQEEKTHVTISVKDFGIGIPPAHLQHIFDRYYRVGQPDQAIGGLGIGLYIVKKIIERHNGTIYVESTEGIGSTFYFTLPLSLT